MKGTLPAFTMTVALYTTFLSECFYFGSVDGKIEILGHMEALFLLLRNLHIFFSKGGTRQHCNQQCRRILFFRRLFLYSLGEGALGRGKCVTETMCKCQSHKSDLERGAQVLTRLSGRWYLYTQKFFLVPLLHSSLFGAVLWQGYHPWRRCPGPGGPSRKNCIL